jgi:hypothetical protein
VAEADIRAQLWEGQPATPSAALLEAAELAIRATDRKMAAIMAGVA